MDQAAATARANLSGAASQFARRHVAANGTAAQRRSSSAFALVALSDRSLRCSAADDDHTDSSSSWRLETQHEDTSPPDVEETITEANDASYSHSSHLQQTQQPMAEAPSSSAQAAASSPELRLGSVFGVGAAGSDSGWVWALAVLLALRLSRGQSEEERYFLRQRQLELYGLRSVSRELLEKRRQYLASEAATQQQQRTERVAAARQRAVQLDQQRTKDQQRYAEEAEREAARLREQMEEQRKVYEERERALKAEYDSRVEQERQIREEAAQRAREKERVKREAEAARKAKLDEERRQREEEQRLAREAEVARRMEEKRQLAQLKRTFAITCEGSATAARPPKGTMTAGRLPKEARVELRALMSTLVAGSPAESRTVLFPSMEEAREGVAQLAATAARAAADDYASAMQLQAMMDQGPLTFLDDQEFEAWMASATVRGAAALSRSLHAMLDKLPGTKGNADASEGVKVRTPWAALDREHPSSLPAQLSVAISAIEDGRASDALNGTLFELFEEGEKEMTESLPAGVTPPEHAGRALVLGHLLSRMRAERPARQADAPAWLDRAGAMARDELKEATRDAPKDSLEPLSDIVGAALGPEHPVSSILRELADRNLSPATRRAREQRLALQEAALAARLLEEEWPDYRQMAEARIAEQEANTPIPERVWALRNVAGTLAIGGPGERARARGLLEQAAGLKQVYVGGQGHPGALPELLALYEVLSRGLDGGGRDGGGGGDEGDEEFEDKVNSLSWKEAAAGAARDVIKLLGVVGNRYASKGEPASAVVLLEAGVRAFEDTVGYRDAALGSATKRSEQLFELLEPWQRQAVAAKRGEPGMAVVAQVASAFTEQLGVYSQPGSSSRAGAWDEGGLAPLQPLV